MIFSLKVSLGQLVPSHPTYEYVLYECQTTCLKHLNNLLPVLGGGNIWISPKLYYLFPLLLHDQNVWWFKMTTPYKDGQWLQSLGYQGPGLQQLTNQKEWNIFIFSRITNTLLVGSQDHIRITTHQISALFSMCQAKNERKLLRTKMRTLFEKAKTEDGGLVFQELSLRFIYLLHL